MNSYVIPGAPHHAVLAESEDDARAKYAAIAALSTPPATPGTATPTDSAHVREVDDAGQRVRHSRMPNTSGEVAP
jgi:hypothetical protein